MARGFRLGAVVRGALGEVVPGEEGAIPGAVRGADRPNAIPVGFTPGGLW